ncbi:MAG: IS630 family transposase [Eubacteriaceae bacterium]|nr:IS630 family transposase [Eubacteriaceae bacterium]
MPKRQLDDDVKEKREAFRQQAKGLDISKISFLDETSFNTGMALPYGWGKGRVECYVPDTRYEKSTLVSTISLDGKMAPILIGSAMNGDTFLSYVEQSLLPSMQRGQTLVLDNLSSHKVEGVEEAFAEAGINLLYLPPYSFDFNPIEQMFSKAKGIVRSKMPRDQQSLIDAIGEALDQITLSDIQGWFLNCGYSCEIL